MSDELHLNEIDCVRLLVSANQEVYCVFLLLLKHYIPILIMLTNHLFFFWSFCLVGFNGTGTVGDYAASCGALVH